MTSFARFVRSAPLSVLGSTAARVQELTEADSVLRAPTALSRRIGFVQARGGAGASSTAAYVASMLARRRSGYVLGVNASPGTTGLPWQAGLPAGAEHRPSERRRSARRLPDAVDGLPRTSSGLWSLDLGALGSPRAPAPTSAWFDAVSPISRFFDVVVTDWGVRSWQIDLAQVASASHVLCLVARADRHSAEETATLVDALSDAEDGLRLVLALVNVGGTAGRAPAILRDQLEVPVVAIPHDAARGAARPVSSELLGTRTRIAYTRLATELMAAALPRTGRPAEAAQA